jgi:hypothetical protein
LWCSLRTLRQNARWTGWLAVAAALAAALLTKALAVTLVPLPLLAAGLRATRREEKCGSAALGGTAALAVALAAAGWWYWHTWVLTGTLSGEQIEAAASRFGMAAHLRAALALNWMRVADTAAFSHIWIGGWSALVARSWMYRVFEFAGAAAVAGLVAAAVRGLPGMRRRPASGTAGERYVLAGAAWLAVCAALASHSVSIYLEKGISTSNGWYLYAAVAAEAVLLALGMASLAGQALGTAAMAALCALAAAFDLYTLHFVSLPVYTGFALHRAGAWSGLPPGTVTALWILYAAATIALPIAAVYVAGGFHRPTLHAGGSLRYAERVR